jgi:hypothetical protein
MSIALDVPGTVASEAFDACGPLLSSGGEGSVLLPNLNILDSLRVNTVFSLVSVRS